MRKTLMLWMMAGVAIPSLASAAPGDRDDRREARQEEREDKAERLKRAERSEQREDRQERNEARGERRQQVREQAVEQRAPVNRVAPSPEQRRQVQVQRREALEDKRAVRRDDRVEQREERLERRIERRAPPVVSRVPREGTQPPPPQTTRNRSSTSHRWNGNWRNDHRYDWNHYRNRHRSLFRLGFYTDPFGWGYRPYSIGWRLWPSYYSRNFWLNDPWMYRLPPAYPGTRWIRYYDDALLVDTWNGEVIDVIDNFFW